MFSLRWVSLGCDIYGAVATSHLNSFFSFQVLWRRGFFCVNICLLAECVRLALCCLKEWMPLTPHIFFFRFCEMCHGLYSKVYYHWTQGSATLCMGSKSLVSFVSFFSFVLFLTCIPACRHAWLPQLVCFDSTNINYNWPPLSVFLAFFCLSPSGSFFLSCLSVSLCLPLS